VIAYQIRHLTGEFVSQDLGYVSKDRSHQSCGSLGIKLYDGREEGLDFTFRSSYNFATFGWAEYKVICKTLRRTPILKANHPRLYHFHVSSCMHLICRCKMSVTTRKCLKSDIHITENRKEGTKFSPKAQPRARRRAVDPPRPSAQIRGIWAPWLRIIN
jgi:hypothetical protein